MADFNSLYKLYEDQLAAAKASAAKAQDEKNAQAQNAYDATVKALEENYASGRSTVNQGYDSKIDQQNQVSDNALKEAYISKMMSQRNLGQQMAAQGRSGGAAESTLLGLQNAYNTSRAQTEQQRAGAVEQLNLARQGELSQLLQTLNAGKAGAQETLYDRMSAAEDNYNQLLLAAQQTYQQQKAAAQAQELQYQMQQEELARQAAAQAAAAAQSAGSAGRTSSGTRGSSQEVKTNNPVWGNVDQLASQLSKQGYTDEQTARYINNLMLQQGVSAAVRERTLAQLGL